MPKRILDIFSTSFLWDNLRCKEMPTGQGYPTKNLWAMECVGHLLIPITLPVLGFPLVLLLEPVELYSKVVHGVS